MLATHSEQNHHAAIARSLAYTFTDKHKHTPAPMHLPCCYLLCNALPIRHHRHADIAPTRNTLSHIHSTHQNTYFTHPNGHTYTHLATSCATLCLFAADITAMRISRPRAILSRTYTRLDKGTFTSNRYSSVPHMRNIYAMNME